jgi:hypothetical protein
LSINKKLIWILTLPVLLFTGGCSGIHASHSVSPLDFFMPGIGGFLYAPSPNAPGMTAAPPQLFVQAH